MPMAMIALTAPGPNSAVIRMATITAGKAKRKSDNRSTSHSSGPPHAAAASPSGTPIPAPIATASADTRKLVIGPRHDQRGHVTPQIVGAQPMRAARPQEPPADIDVGDGEGGPHQRHQRDDRKDQRRPEPQPAGSDESASPLIGRPPGSAADRPAHRPGPPPAWSPSPPRSGSSQPPAPGSGRAPKSP